jgi:tetratricopeptide (TPR) repeat protein
LNSQYQLGSDYYHQDKYDEAEEFFRQTLEATERVLGPDHPITLRVVHNLALVIEGRKRYDEASILYQRADLKSQERLGSGHPDTQIFLKHHSSLLERMKQI